VKRDLEFAITYPQDIELVWFEKRKMNAPFN